MKRCTQPFWLPALFAAAALIGPSTFCAAQDNGQLYFVPEEHPGPPYYMLLLEHESQDVVPLVFIRPGDCIPEDFNLLDHFHFGPGGAQSCPLNAEGFVITPALTGPPNLLHLQNPIDGAVPVGFVSRDEYLDEIADGELFISDVEAMDTLVMAAATKYQDTQSVLTGKVHITARGLLEDGRTFRFELEEHFDAETVTVVHYDVTISD